MEQQELLIKLRDYYAKHIEAVEQMEESKMYGYLCANYLHVGICYAAWLVFGKDIDDNLFDDYLLEGSDYVAPRFYWGYSKSQMIDTLTTRLLILHALTNPQ